MPGTHTCLQDCFTGALVCQHGSQECDANRYLACAKQVAGEHVLQFMSFAHCPCLGKVLQCLARSHVPADHRSIMKARDDPQASRQSMTRSPRHLLRKCCLRACVAGSTEPVNVKRSEVAEETVSACADANQIDKAAVFHCSGLMTCSFCNAVALSCARAVNPLICVKAFSALRAIPPSSHRQKRHQSTQASRLLRTGWRLIRNLLPLEIGCSQAKASTSKPGFQSFNIHKP